MLNTCTIMGFIPTRNPARSRAFYVDLLGLTFVSEDDFAIELDANGIPIRITKAPAYTPLPFSLLGWRVPDIAAVVADLTAKDVVFERYGFLQQDAAGIWTAPDGSRVAWFRDTEGNLLSLAQQSAQQ